MSQHLNHPSQKKPKWNITTYKRVRELVDAGHGRGTIADILGLTVTQVDSMLETIPKPLFPRPKYDKEQTEHKYKPQVKRWYQ